MHGMRIKSHKGYFSNPTQQRSQSSAPFWAPKFFSAPKPETRAPSTKGSTSAKGNSARTVQETASAHAVKNLPKNSSKNPSPTTKTVLAAAAKPETKPTRDKKAKTSRKTALAASRKGRATKKRAARRNARA